MREREKLRRGERAVVENAISLSDRVENEICLSDREVNVRGGDKIKEREGVVDKSLNFLGRIYCQLQLY